MKNNVLLALAMASVVTVPAVAAAQTAGPWVAVTPPPGATTTVTLMAPAYGPPPAALAPAAPVVAPAPAPVGWAPAQPTLYGQDEARPSRVGRYFVEGLAGLGAGLGGAMVGGLVGLAMGSNATADCASTGPCGGGMNLGPLMAGVGIGWFGGVPLGVTLAGNARGGNGGYGWSLLGTLGGSMAAGLVGYAINPDPADGGNAVGYLGLLGGVVGAVVGYELSNTADRDRAHRVPVRTAAVRLTPSASASPQGAVVGVAGTF